MPPASPPPPGLPIPVSSLGLVDTRRNKGPSMTKRRIAFLFILLILLAATTLGALYVISNRHTNTNTVGGVPVVGHVYFEGRR
jgi:hypothetical protein